MTIATVTEFREGWEGPNKQALASAICNAEYHNDWSSNRYTTYGRRLNQLSSPSYKLSDQEIQKFLDSEYNKAIAHQMGKGIRPWDIVDVSKRLDKNQPWIGIEYETGYNKEKDYQKVINFFWNSFNNAAVDGEGAGQYPCELTFSPVNLNDFMSETGPMDKLLGFINDNNVTTASWYADEDEADENYSDNDDEDDEHYGDYHVGTHCNISTPAFRAATYEQQERITTALNTSLNRMSDTSKRRFFGRLPYGGFGLQTPNGGNNRAWIEGKLFNSTADIDQWKKYKQVIVKLAEIIEAMALAEIPAIKRTGTTRRYWEDDDDRYPCISNFVGVLSGKVAIDAMKIGFTRTADDDNDYW